MGGGYGNQTITYFTVISGARLVTVSDLDVVVNELIKQMSNLVKATIETRFGHVGTVGAMLVEEFIDKIKVAMGEVVTTQASSVSEAGSGCMSQEGRLPLSSVVQLTMMTTSSQPAEGSEGGCASVPSAFGQLESSTSVALESTKLQNLVRKS